MVYNLHLITLWLKMTFSLVIYWEFELLLSLGCCFLECCSHLTPLCYLTPVTWFVPHTRNTCNNMYIHETILCNNVCFQSDKTHIYHTDNIKTKWVIICIFKLAYWTVPPIGWRWVSHMLTICFRLLCFSSFPQWILLKKNHCS